MNKIAACLLLLSVSVPVLADERILDFHSDILVKTNPGSNAAALAAGEQELYDGLFADGKVVVLENENHEKLGEAKAGHKRSLQDDYKQHYFRTNGLLNIPAILIFVATAIVALQAGPSAPVLLVIVAMAITTIFFAIIMKRPTMRGRKLLDEIRGFEDYLEIAEKNLRNPPEKTPELFEAYLPFALALGIDQLWAEVADGDCSRNNGPD